MNTKTQVTLGFFSHYLNLNFTFINHLKKLKTLVVFALGISELLASEIHSNFLCTDDDKPIITIDIGACEPAIKNIVDNICYGHLVLTAEATDDQTPKDDLVFEYKVDLFNDGIGSHQGYEFYVGPLTRKDFIQGALPLFHDNPYAANENNPFSATGTYPIGIHKICWYVTDSSGNQAALCQLFEIKDCKAPTPYCLTGLLTLQMPSTGCVTFWAKDLDRSSFDNCTQSENLKFYFDGDPTAISMTICCDDFVATSSKDELFVDVQMWVEDEEGNTDYCKTTIIVKDNQNICGGHQGRAKVIGNVYSIQNRKDTMPVKNVNIGIYGSSGHLGKSLITNADGIYLFGELINGTYTLGASKNDQHYDYVSTYDIIRIQEHILGTKPMSHFYQLILADVNNSHSITTGDVSELRKLILRSIDSFNKVQSWILFPIIDPPAMLPTSSIQFELKLFESKKIDFRAIKMGDVNDLISSDSDKLLIPNANDSLVFNFINRQFKAGDTLYVDFYSKNFNNILGYQYTLKFDAQYLKYEEVIPQNLFGIGNSNFGIRYKDSGYVTTSWSNANGLQKSVKPDEALFTFKFLAINDGNLCDLLSITSDLTPAEAYRDSFNLHNIKLDVCDVFIDTKSETEDLFNVYPNPFQKEINFYFSEAVHFPLQIEIYSLEGKKIGVQQIVNAVEDWTWNANQLKEGVYLLRLIDGENIVFRKMIKE